jgi:hypothetical protein
MNIPEGFVLVPKSMLLDKETIGAINFHCGDGADGQFGEYSDGHLWVGTVTDDDGKEVHGLHLATSEYPEEGSTTLVEFPAVIADPKPAAHLTIPGALEWDGDNGTHGADGESRADCEYRVSSTGPEGKRERFQKWVMATKHPTFGFLDGRSLARGDDREGYADEYVQGLWVSFKEFDAQLANTEQSRRSFFDLSQDLEKRLAERDALLKQAAGYGGLTPLWHAKVGQILSCSAEPAKQKTCIECDQPYCHGVCVERGDQDYDRDQAAKGGDDE